MDFERMTQRTASQALGVATKTLQRWTHQGCPRNSDNSYSLPQVFEWVVALKEADTGGAETKESQKWLTAFRKERALLAKIERKKAEGGLIPVEEVRKDVFDMARLARDAILNVPERIAAILAAEKDQGKVREILNNELRQALEGVARGETWTSQN